jgi:RNA polymerase sigma-70 factor (ECF subfamily)
MVEPVLDATDDALLVARAKRDRRTFAALYARYFDPVYRYCYRRLGSHEAAEDAAALVFEKALAALPGFRAGDPDGSPAPSGSFRSWLFRIAHNVVADHFRGRRIDQPLEAAADFLDAAPSPEEAAVDAEAHRTLLDLLAGLPEDQRRVLELRLAGLSGAEIAAALGRSHPAVKMLQSRAVARLRALRAADGDGERDGRR